MQYEDVSDVLFLRFKDILIKKPELKSCDNPFDFFKHGLKVDDIEPTLFQAQCALAKAKKETK